jgi:peptidoglycan/LPS O-acetylase OafA/YrhL
VPATSDGLAAGAGRRRDIQGLRAVAVLVVVAFHAGLPLPGGFVGVDVFFVISGFVITAMLAREWHATGRIRFGRFYLRRFKRLSPALALVVVATVLASTFLLSPLGPQQTAAKTGIGAMLITANVVISRTSGGYFDAPAGANPLLHTWSLSVEEQFYLVFPLLLALGWWLATRRSRYRGAAEVSVAIVAVASFALTLVALHRPLGPVAEALMGFYGPLTRAWEFAVGALVVLVLTRVAPLSWRTAAVLGLIGAGLLGVSLSVISESTPFPGPWTLLPVAATGLLLVAGTQETTPVSRVLASRPFVAVGDWSYSIYLWHWPFIVYAKVLWPGHDAAVLAAAALSVLPAVASYRWLETPLRRLRVPSKAAVTRVVAAVLAPALAASVAILGFSSPVSAKKLESRPAGTTLAGEIGWKDHDYRFGGFEPCASPVLRQMVDSSTNYQFRCQQSKPGADIDLALIGDSHVEHLFIGLVEALPDLNIMYFATDAPLGVAEPAYREAVRFITRTPSIRDVLATSYWHQRGVVAPDVTAFLRALSVGGRHVYLTDDVPDFPFEPFGCKYASGLVPRTCSQDAPAFWGMYQAFVDQMAAVVAAVPRAVLVHTARYLCDETVCSMTRDGQILYADRSHLNVLGSEYVARRLLADYPELAAG